MKDEIKEILDNKLYFDLEEEDYIKIKDYITNLQEENKKLNYCYSAMILNFQLAINKIDKAIKFIESTGYGTDFSMSAEEVDKLFNILNGSDNDSK